MRRAVLAALLLLTAATVSAATFQPISRQQIVDRADLIVAADVESASSRWQDGLIVTDYTLRVLNTDQILTVTELGGIVGDAGLHVDDSAVYEVGSRVVASLRARGDGTYFTAYMKHGVQRLDVEAGAVASDYTISDGNPRKPLRWKSCDQGCIIDWTLNGAHPNVDTPLGLERAFNAWINDPTSFVSFDLVGLTPINAIARDGQNTILLDNNSSMPASACDGALGCSAVWFNTASQHTFDGVSFYDVLEADVLVRPSVNTQTNFEAVLAHELGHALALRHAPDGTTALMSATIPTSQGATLRAWDKEAMTEVYGPGIACTAPGITNVNGSGTVVYGTTATLTAVVTGTTPITYQWYDGEKDDTSKPVGTNSATYTTPAITTQRKFWVKATNSCGSASSSTVIVNPTECNEPQIDVHPAGQRVTPNSSATLTVEARGTAPLKYDWYEGQRGDTTKKVGTNSTQFTTPSLTATTTYWVRVSNACGQADSNAAAITVGNPCVAPTIALQPVGGDIALGEKAALHVSASGDPQITFQWYEGISGDTSKPIANATSALYEPGPFTTAGVYRFWARATNHCGSADSNTAVVTAGCGPAAAAPTIFAPPVAPRSIAYEVSWTGNLATTPTFEVQESTSSDFAGATTFSVSNALKLVVPARTTVGADTRYYYRVRAQSPCSGQFTAWSTAADTVVTALLPQTATDFAIGLPQSTTEPFKQDYLVPGFGETATNGDTFTITSDVPWMTVFPPSGALSAGGTTIQITIDPAMLGAGSASGSLKVERVNGTTVAITNIPVSVTLAPPVTHAPRDTNPPAGTLLIPAVAHADGIGTRFQSDVRITNTSGESVTYDLAFTPSGSDGTATGKKTTIVIGANETRALDDVVKMWFGENGLGTLEIRPAEPLVTFASSRTYAIGAAGTLGQFIPALPLSSFIGDHAQDPQAVISLQQIAHNARYRTNVGLVEGAGQPVNVSVVLRDASNNLQRAVLQTLQPYEHRHLSLSALFGAEVVIDDGRVEIQVPSSTGRVSAYASVLDNDTTDPLLVFPVQAQKLSATQYVVPGVAELNAASNFHTDMRIYNPASSQVTVSLTYKPQRGDSTPVPAPVTATIGAGHVLSIDNVLPTIWSITASGGAVTVTAPSATPLVVTARTFSREADGGTYGQFIPAVTSSEAVGLGDRALEVLQLEDSPSFRSNLGLVEVTGNPATVELTLRPPDATLASTLQIELAGGEFLQLGRVFHSLGYPNVYNGRVSIRVIAGTGRVAGYGSVVDNRTADPTYVLGVRRP